MTHSLNTLKSEYELAMAITRAPYVSNLELMRNLVKANELRQLIDDIENGD